MLEKYRFKQSIVAVSEVGHNPWKHASELPMPLSQSRRHNDDGGLGRALLAQVSKGMVPDESGVKVALKQLK
jgi:hypothetical protein